MKKDGPGNCDGLFQFFRRSGTVCLSLSHKVFLDMLCSGRVRNLDVIIPGPALTSEIVPVTSIFPVFALSIKRRNASNLSVDGSLMSDFGLYKSHVGATLRGNVTSVCRMQVNQKWTHYKRLLFFVPGKGHSWTLVREPRS
jgi:hypothetical protein